MKLITHQQEASVATEVLAKTYANAPNINWMFAQTPGNLRYFFGMLVEDAMHKKGAYLTSDHCGVLLFHESKATNFSLSSIFKKLYVIIFITGIMRAIQIVRLNRLKAKYRPGTGYYGSVLGIMQHKYQWKTTFELKKEFSMLSKKVEQPIYLETTDPRIFSLYKKIGFSKYHEMKHPYTNLMIYFMKKDKV